MSACRAVTRHLNPSSGPEERNVRIIYAAREDRHISWSILEPWGLAVEEGWRLAPPELSWWRRWVVVQPEMIPHHSGKDEAESSSFTQRRCPSCLSSAILGVSGGGPGSGFQVQCALVWGETFKITISSFVHKDLFGRGITLGTEIKCE